MGVALSKLSDYFNEQSTGVIVAALKDELGKDATPVTMTWTLTDVNGTVINNRENITVETPASTNNIFLTGDDLAVTENSPTVTRILTVQGTYNSELQSGLSFKDSIRFEIRNLKKV